MRQKPAMIRACEIQEDGSTKMVTMRLDSMKKPEGPRHDDIGDGLRARAVATWRVGQLVRSDLATVEQWVDGFKYDTHPGREIQVWEHIARAFDALGGPSLGTMKQLRIVKALTYITMGGVDVESQTGLSSAVVKELREALRRTAA